MPAIYDPVTGKVTNPCTVAIELRTAYYALLSGGNETRIRYKGPNGEEEVEYGSTNMEELKAAMVEMDGLCAAETGANPNRRFAIRGGSMRSGYEG
jgi:hypothetical protein